MALEPNLPTSAPESAAQSSPPDPTSVRTYAATAAAIVNSKLSLAALKLWATANPHRNLILHAAASGAKKMTEIHDQRRGHSHDWNDLVHNLPALRETNSTRMVKSKPTRGQEAAKQSPSLRAWRWGLAHEGREGGERV